MAPDEAENRTEVRSLGVVLAFVSDPAGLLNIKCSIRDLSQSGCRIVTPQVRDLPDLVLLTPEGFRKPLSAMIVWRIGKMAGLLFEHAADEEGKARFANLRAVHKREDERLHRENKCSPAPQSAPVLSFSDRLMIWRSSRLRA